MEMTEVGAPGGEKVSGSLLRKAKRVFILYHIPCLRCMCFGTT